MNICFLIGKIVSEIEFDFIINNNGSLGKEKMSVVKFKIKVFNEEICVIGYNNLADFCYQNLVIGKNVYIEGFVNTNGKVEIKYIKLI